MKSYISQVSQAQPPQNATSLPNPDISVLIWTGVGIGLGGIGTFLATFIPKFLDSEIVTKKVVAGINQRQAETNAVVAEKLTDINIDKQKEENFIDQSNALADIAKAGVHQTSETTNYLLKLTGDAIASSHLNNQSTHSLLKAGENQVKATEDLIAATKHNSNALQALKEAIEGVPEQLTSINEVYFAEFRLALDGIDRKLLESNQLKREGYSAIEKAIRASEVKIIDQYTETMAQVRRELSGLAKEVHHDH
jgi:hypothetical protein